MATPSSELRQFFAGAVNDARQEEFLCWLADVDERVREISRKALDVMDVCNPGWVDLWEQDASVPEVIDALRAIDFEFESHWDWENWRTKRG